MKRSLQLSSMYLGVVVFFIACIWFLISHGEAVFTTTAVSVDAPPANQSVLSYFSAHLQHPLAILLLQIMVILGIVRIISKLMSFIRQPSVIGEIIGGILLGPSVLGYFFPEFGKFLFASGSLGNLQALSQIGLIFFMFLIGLELDLSSLRKKTHAAVLISHASIIFPFFLGVALSLFLYKDFAAGKTGFSFFAVFMGIAMSITAFPVLARIIQERNLSGTPIGSMAIACAAADDVTAWCLLAFIISVVKAGSAISALWTLILAVIYVLAMFFLVKPFWYKIARRYDTRETLVKPVVALCFFVVLASAWLAEIIGIHALFGAFLAGVIAPRQLGFRLLLTDKLEDVSQVLLLPLFFAFTGLRTSLGLLHEAELWLITLLVIAVAVVGKLAGSAIAARATGQNWADSLRLGTLMNTRGLMELVVLNIGYDLGILSDIVFTMMVIMALVTTFMTGPIIDFIDYLEEKLRSKKNPRGSILVSFATPHAGARLFMIAAKLLENKTEKISTLHFSPSADIKKEDADFFRQAAFAPISLMENDLKMQTEKIYRAVNNPGSEIYKIAEKGKFALVLTGSSQPLFTKSDFGGILKKLIHSFKGDVGILLDRDFQKLNRVVFLLASPTDSFLQKYASLLMINGAAVAVLDETPAMAKFSKHHWPVLEQVKLTKAKSLHKFDLLITSLATYKLVQQENPSWLQEPKGILVLRNGI